MELPLILAGPILRRVDPGTVAVWMAFSEPAELELRVWEGRVAHDSTNPVFVSSADPPDPSAPPPRPGADAIRVGEHLYLGLVTARIPPASAKVFLPDRLYSYDVIINAGGEVLGLGERGMLATRTVNGVEVPPLGYDDRMLPSFALPPSELEHLRIAYGSCRRPGYDDGDALAWIDDVLAFPLDDPPLPEPDPDSGEPSAAIAVGDPRTRIHQLFLGGDQIYADDVDTVMMLRVAELGVELIGRDGGPAGTPIERVKVKTVLRRKAGQLPTDSDPTAAYEPEPAAETAAQGDLPAGADHFPVGQRLDLTQRNAQFTSIDGANHLISFGEFAALHLMVWSPAVWGELVPGAEVLRVGDTQRSQLRWLDVPEELGPISWPFADFPDRIPEHLYADKDTLAARAKDAGEDAEANERKAEKARAHSHRVHRDFLLGLGKVQRVLANVPTYMILDDHDLTDDLFLNPMWRRRVLGSPLGQTILTNGMLAYALFQDWGNDPRRYDQATDSTRPDLGGQLPGDLLERATGLFPPGATKGPDPDAFVAVAKMFGHDLENTPDLDGRYRPVKPPLTWHFSVDGPRHRVVALDNRTRRSYAAEIGPPGNVSPEALVDQLPPPPLPAGRKVLVVVAPLQVIGPGVLDELVSPAIYRIFDMVKAGDLTSDKVGGSRRMPGTNPDALETWSLEPLAYEHLLQRLAEYQRVVVLSGDVHNSTGNLMSYWRGNASTPARIAQFTSSGMKNVMPVYLRALDQSAMLLQQLLRMGIGIERFGWDRPAEDLVLLPPGRSDDDLVAATRAKLLRSPVLLPAHGWIDDNPRGAEPLPELTTRLNPANPPDWRWRARPLLDTRPDSERPTPIRVTAIDDAAVEAQLADPEQVLDALQTIAARHQSALARMRNARQMLFRSNFGVCRFIEGKRAEDEADDAITAVHELYTSAIDPETQLPVLNRYLVQEAPLGPVVEPPPTELRVAVIERRPIPAAPA
ncbi:hypothetical protein [Desertimonas flava]|uniref:hypothetical protein n=1 Tax=Desertimonas flava TaxID=2064846 RepID=UPI000E341D81|nr:hypothetical protein [Desertimonas flava]